MPGSIQYDGSPGSLFSQRGTQCRPRASGRPLAVRRAFTLVELLIVVAILGILSALVVPKFSSATDTARYSSLKNTVKIVRSQLNLFNTQHTGDWPDLVTDGWAPLTDKTDEDQTLNASGTLGPYLQKDPVNTFTGGTVISGDETNRQDWLYDPSTGDFKAFMNAEDYNRLQLDDADIVLYIVAPATP